MSEFEYKLSEYKEEDIPSTEIAVSKALELAKTIQTDWTKGKQYQKGNEIIDTFTTDINGDFWMARVSKHKDVSFESFRKGIYENHTEQEVEYIPLLDSYKILQDNIKENWRDVLVHYKFPKLFSDREMTVFITAVQPDPEVKQFLIISLPSDRTVDPEVTRAYYCSIELVTYLEDEDCVEWIAAQTSDACGNIPRWVQNRSVTASVVEDVPHFIEWAKGKYGDENK